MKVQCILNREGGTKAEIDGIEYHFEVLADGAHVAEVEHEAHIDRFLAIPEGYKVYHGEEEPKGKPTKLAHHAHTFGEAPKPAKTDFALAGSEQLPPQFEIGGKVITQLDAVKLAFEASGMTSDEWNELGEDDRTAKIEIALDELAEQADATGDEVKDETPEPAKKPAAKKTSKK